MNQMPQISTPAINMTGIEVEEFDVSDTYTKAHMAPVVWIISPKTVTVTVTVTLGGPDQDGPSGDGL